MAEHDPTRGAWPRALPILLCTGAMLAAACNRDAAPQAAPAVATRVVPACAAAVDYLTWLGCADRIAALPEQALEHSRGVAGAGALAALPRFATFRAEALLAHAPDLVLCDWYQAADTCAALRRAGVRVVALGVVRDWPDIAANLRRTGEALGCGAHAEASASEWERRAAATLARAAGAGPLVLPCFDHGTGARTAGAGTIEDLAIRLAGARNHAVLLGLDGHVALPVERVLARQPDWLLAGDEDQRAALFASPALRQLDAVRAGRLVSIPKAYRDATSPYVLDGAAQLARALADFAGAKAGTR